MNRSLRTSVLPFILSFLLVLEGCGPFDDLVRRTYSPSSFIQQPDASKQALQTTSPYVKLHMKNGTVALLNKWSADDNRRVMEGVGSLYSAQRDTIRSGKLAIGLDSVLIIETNEVSSSGTRLALTIFMGVTGVVAAFCIANPKACFGSCPTFYVPALDSLRPKAEGFSASIAPSLEATDCDALGDIPLTSTELTLEMRNEALETHVVRSVSILAVPKHEGTTIYKDDHGSFLECTGLLPPSRATGEEGSCLALLASADNRERVSRADSTDLAAKETIDLRFDTTPGDTCGLVIGCRQSLMTTFLFYKTLGYMGKDAGQWFAEMEREKVNEPMRALEELLGGINVFVGDSTGTWHKAGSVLEYGPLATDIHIVRIPSGRPGPLTIRLEMTKGYWRIDNVGLTHVRSSVAPVRIAPSMVLRDGIRDDIARAMLLDPARTLVTKPGDTYSLHFDLPAPANTYGLFLESRGYYLEWIRESWMKEENPLALGEILFDPASALRRMAPEFARTERAVEEQFWRSKYAR